MVQVKGKWHPNICGCNQCTALREEVGIQRVLEEKPGVLTTRGLISRACLAPNGKLSERLKDGRIITVLVSVVRIPGLKKHAKAYWYIDGKRIARATAALILRNHT